MAKLTQCRKQELPVRQVQADDVEHPFIKHLSVNDHAVLAVRNLVFDLTHQNAPGHGGGALGMAAIAVALWKYTMKYNPSDPSWFNRDRFVLSNGHSAMLLYIMNYLTGFDDWTMEELKGYGSSKEGGFDTICHAHPEIEVPGVEVTTGPLGQGIANAVGLAIASKNVGARFNRPGFPIVDSRVYCMTGDGCLMEGVALEAIALAGHHQLDNLTLIYDRNEVTCDGPLEWINNEDMNAKMRACGWEVITIADGCYDVDTIVHALAHARSIRDKPTFVNIRTIIGVGTANQDTYKAHHGLFDLESIEKSKMLAGLDPAKSHEVPDAMLDFFRERKAAGQNLHASWDQLFAKYAEHFPEEANELWLRREGGLGEKLQQTLGHIDSAPFKGLATRTINGVVLDKIWGTCSSIFGGGADLIGANQVKFSEDGVFGRALGYHGRYIRYGIREHAMAAISNGIAAFSPGTFLPVTATFLMFYLYASPGVRMGALSGLQVIHCATHDSFAEGQNGPTHQPVEVDSLFRAMPGLTFIRPSDGEEVIGAWQYAVNARHRSSIISLARDSTGSVPNTSRDRVSKGCYVIVERDDAALTLASCGSNLHYVVATAEELGRDGLPTRVVSAPSLELFAEQGEEYQDTIFPIDNRPIVSVEEYVPTVWARYVTASIGMYSYGCSASNKSNYRRFKLDTEGILSRIRPYLKLVEGKNARSLGWKQI